MIAYCLQQLQLPIMHTVLFHTLHIHMLVICEMLYINCSFIYKLVLTIVGTLAIKRS